MSFGCATCLALEFGADDSLRALIVYQELSHPPARMSGPGAAQTAPALAPPVERCDMPESTCSVVGCEKRASKVGLCSMHGFRWYKWGDVGPPGQVKAPRLLGTTLAERLLLNHEVSPEGCWRWTGAHDRAGYGRTSFTLPDGRRVTSGVHRFAYQEFIGPIPDGLTVDHVRSRGCVHRDCINPAHLEAVTRGENVRRANPDPDRVHYRSLWTHCPHGHEFTEENIYWTAAGRSCLECRRRRARETYHRRKGRSG